MTGQPSPWLTLAMTMLAFGLIVFVGLWVVGR